MPVIDTELLLDVLLALIILLFVPFGVRRGVAKEAMVSGGILLGAVVADRWAVRGGAELADRFGVPADTAPFLVAVASLAIGALVLGYGGGAALGRLPQGVLARLAGGLLAALNGALLVAFVLTFLRDYLRDGRDLGAVDDGFVGRALLRDFDWMVLAAAALLGLAVLFGLIVTAFRRRNEPIVLPSVEGVGIPPRQRPARLPRGGDAGKYEPYNGPPPPESRPGRFGGGGGSGTSSMGHTTPLLDRPDAWQSTDEPKRGASWPRPRAGLDLGHGSNGHDAAPTGAIDWLRLGSESAPIDRTFASGSTEGKPNDDHVWRPPSDQPAPADDRRRCPTCGASLASHDVFCAECGTTL